MLWGAELTHCVKKLWIEGFTWSYAYWGSVNQKMLSELMTISFGLLNCRPRKLLTIHWQSPSTGSICKMPPGRVWLSAVCPYKPKKVRILCMKPESLKGLYRLGGGTHPNFKISPQKVDWDWMFKINRGKHVCVSQWSWKSELKYWNCSNMTRTLLGVQKPPIQSKSAIYPYIWEPDPWWDWLNLAI